MVWQNVWGSRVKCIYLSRILQIRLTSELKPEGSGVCQALGGRAFHRERPAMKRSRGRQAFGRFKNEGRAEGEEAGVCHEERCRAEPTDEGKRGPGGYTYYSDDLQAWEECRLLSPCPPAPALDLSEVWLLHNMWRWLYRPTACLGWDWDLGMFSFYIL